jgi:hypothetical protein
LIKTFLPKKKPVVVCEGSNLKKQMHTAVLLATLISTLAGTLLVNVSLANPYVPALNGAVVKLLLPENKTYDSNSVPISFTVESPYPDGWEITAVYGVKLYLDGDSCENAITIGASRRYSSTLTGLELGSHCLYVVAYVSYKTSERYSMWVTDPADGSGSSKVVYFAVTIPKPVIKILSIDQQQTFSVDAVPLDFTVSKPVSWMGYSLDGQDNVTVSGNTTLTDLPQGTHDLLVYATDSYGQTAKSLIRHFTIDTTTFSLSFPTTLVTALALISAAAVLIAVLFYFKRRKNQAER